MTYRIGELDQRVTFRREVATPDGMGGSVLSWVDVVTAWALVRPMSGRERLQGERVNASANYLIVIHNRADIDETCKAVWSGYEFNLAFRKDRGGRPIFLEIEAERGAAV